MKYLRRVEGMTKRCKTKNKIVQEKLKVELFLMGTYEENGYQSKG